ncbi:MAG TPA: histidine phosphatase family protein [Pyrinomonadaceae bacterium]|nr:histidine phosphatase family protein [Pyrinomonadaceae bacterium]
MKVLLLLRHAHAAPGDQLGQDLERPLDSRGLKEAEGAGGFLKAQGVKVDLVLCSPARRAQETAANLISATDLQAVPLLDERIYEGSTELLVQVVSELEDKNETVLVVGHNPGLSDLLHLLTAQAIALRPAALARIHFNISSWSNLLEAKGKLEWCVQPNN